MYHPNLILTIKVQTATEVTQKSHHPELTFTGNTLVVIKKPKTKTGHLRVCQFSGQENLRQFSSKIRFKYGMMDHHMPWSYNSIFASKFGRLINPVKS